MVDDSDPPPPIRRGRSLRLSTDEEMLSEESPTEAQGSSPVRGRGLRLSVVSDVTLSVDPGPVPEDLPSVEPGPMPEELPSAESGPVSEELPSAELIPLYRRYRRTDRGWLSYLNGGTGKPLLLLHGWGASARIWVGVGSALVDRRTIYALDLPGAGGVAPRSDAPTLNALVEETLHVVDTLEIAHFDLLGHALGAAVAAAIAARHPDRVGRLGLMSLGMRSFAPELLALRAIRPPLNLLMSVTRPITDLWQPAHHALLQSWPINWTMRALLLRSEPALPQLWQAYLEDRTFADTRVDMTSLTLVGDAALRRDLQAIQVPTLCMAGRNDRLVSIAAVTAAQQLIPESELRLLDGCGHLPMVEHPELLYQTLRQFFV